MISAQLLRKSFFFCLYPKKSALYLLEAHGSSSPLLLHFYSTIVASPNNPKNLESITLFLKENGFSDTQLERVVKNAPQLRSANLEKSVKPKINVFKEFGFSDSEIVETISRQPVILCSSAAKKLYPSLSLLQDLLGSTEQLVKVVQQSRRYFLVDSNKTLCSNIEFLKSHGVLMERILHLLRSEPTALLTKHELLKKQVEKLERMGVDSSSKMFIYGLWAATSLSDKVWELKLQSFRDLGFTESQILHMIRRAPQVLLMSADKIKRIAEVVLATNRYTLSSIMTRPNCFFYSLEKRIKPRLQVLEILDKRKLIKKWPSLSGLVTSTDLKFHRDFIAPYPWLFDGITSLDTSEKLNPGVPIVTSRRAKSSLRVVSNAEHRSPPLILKPPSSSL